MKDSPEFANQQNELGIAFANKGNLIEAIKHFKISKKLNPSSPITCYYLGLAYHRLQNISQALLYYKKAIEFKPYYVLAHNNIGVIYLETNKYKDAEEHFKLALVSDPYNAMALTNLGNIYKLRNNFNQAIDYYRKALDINPRLHEAYNNLGIVLVNTGNYQEAKQMFKKATENKPDYAYAYYHLGMVEMEFKKYDAAIEYFKKALLFNPDLTPVLNMYATVLMQVCDWEESKKILLKLDKITKSELNRNQKTGESPFLSITHADDIATSFFIARNWSHAMEDSVKDFRPPFIFNRKSGKKIRIGYLSNDFGDNAVSHLLFGIFGLHDKKKFEIYGYSYGVNDNSFYHKEIKKDIIFRDIQNLDNNQAAELIYEDQIDILIDLKGHTKDNRLEILALRPAPVQVTYLGFPGSTGASFFDYVITDNIITPKDFAKYYTEKFVYMPDCYQVSSYSYFKNIEKPSRREYGLPENSVVFCSFNQSYKIQEEVFITWMKILRKVPSSVLWLLNDNELSTKNLIKAAQKEGVNKNRLIFTQRVTLKEHLARLTIADIAFDTFPYTGGATTSNALWAGIPVVTIFGKTYASRMSTSLLHALNLKEFIAKTVKEYEDIAINLADPKVLKKTKLKLNKNSLSASLFDTKKFVGNLEKAYLKMVELHNKGGKPQKIVISS